MGFLRTACKRLGIERDFTSIDTLEMCRLMLPHLHKFQAEHPRQGASGRPVRAPPRKRGCGGCSAAFSSSCSRGSRMRCTRSRRADINPVLAATTDRKKQAEKPAAPTTLSFWSKIRPVCAICNSSFPRAFSNTITSAHHAAQRAHPSPRGTDLRLGVRGGRGVPRAHQGCGVGTK